MFTWKTKSGITIKQFKIGITNCFLIQNKELNILVDTGLKKFSNKLVSALKNNVSEKLDYLVLTHTHYDHSQNAKTITNIFTPKIIVHNTESECMKKGYTPIPKGTMLVTKIISNLGRRFTPQLAAYDPVEPDIIINSEYLINDQTLFKIIETPGHTTGSISLIVDNEIVLVGDTMFGHFKNSIMIPFGNDIPEIYKSWVKLLATDCRLFLPAHGKAIKKEKLEKEIKKRKL